MRSCGLRAGAGVRHCGPEIGGEPCGRCFTVVEPPREDPWVIGG